MMYPLMHRIFDACLKTDDSETKARFISWTESQNIVGKTAILCDDRALYMAWDRRCKVMVIRRTDRDYIYIRVQRNYNRVNDKVIRIYGTNFSMYYEECHSRTYTNMSFNAQLEEFNKEYPGLLYTIASPEGVSC